LNFLNEKWKKDKAQLIIIYGKGRVAKTELSTQFVKDKRYTHYLYERKATHKHLKKFAEKLREYFKDEFLLQEGYFIKINLSPIRTKKILFAKFFTFYDFDIFCINEVMQYVVNPRIICHKIV